MPSWESCGPFRGMRPLSSPVLVTATPHITVEAPLCLSEADERVLKALGRQFEHWAGVALRERCRYGSTFDKDAWMAIHHQVRAAGAPTVYANAVVADAKALWRTSRKAQRRQLQDVTKALRVLDQKLSLPPGDPKGYRDRKTWDGKFRRRQHLRSKQARLQRKYDEGRLSITRGGKHLLRNRHSLEESRFGSVDEWRVHWEARRRSIFGAGSSGPHSSLWCRVDPDSGEIFILLPETLRAYANVNPPHTTLPWYRLDAALDLSHYRGRQAWRADGFRRARQQGRPVTYSFSYDPAIRQSRGGWLVRATFEVPLPSAPIKKVGDVRGLRVAAVDLNADHLAVQLLDQSGNPTRARATLALELEGLTTAQRDGLLRRTVEDLAEFCRRHQATVVAIEDLGFSDGTAGRETIDAKKLRHVRSQFPTTIFRHRLVQMLSRRGISVVAVDPAYSSVNGARWWEDTVPEAKKPLSRHLAAAVVIGRRSQRYPDVRSSRCAPATYQRIGDGNANGQHRGAGGGQPRSHAPPGSQNRSRGQVGVWHGEGQPVGGRPVTDNPFWDTPEPESVDHSVRSA